MAGRPIQWGLVGPGGIARKFAHDLRVAEAGSLRSVAGRDLPRAKAFAEEFGAEFAFDDLLAVATDPQVDIVYLATPHSAHFSAARTLLEHGKPLLIEKPMTVNAAQARELIGLARSRGVFLMEALWTRFLPAYQQVGRWLDEGRIGEVRGVSSSFCVRGNPDPTARWLNPALAGGGLLDLGVYNLAMNQWVLGTKPDRIHAVANFSATGVDDMLSASLGYTPRTLAQFACGFVAEAENSLTITGGSGRILVPDPFYAAQEVRLLAGEKIEIHRAPFRGEGFEYEIAEAVRCLSSGELESPLMPLSDTLATLEVMDGIRARIGLRYPFE
jgi:predicted dehydrogenase